MKIEARFVPRHTTFYPGLVGVEITELDRTELIITELPAATYGGNDEDPS